MEILEKMMKNKRFLVRNVAACIWFWRESFAFMKGHNKIMITIGCFKRFIPFCVDVERWYRVKDKQLAYAIMDRTIEL